MSEFEVWSAYHSEPSDEGDRRSYVETISADNAKEAAEIYAGKKFADFEYPHNMELYVKQTPDGDRKVFDISIDFSPNFYASEQIKRATRRVLGQPIAGGGKIDPEFSK